MWDNRARLDDKGVHDGDSVFVILDKGEGISHAIEVRLFGVFAPELSQPGGPETRDFVKAWFAAQPAVKWPFIVTTARTPKSDIEQQTLGRYVATVTSLDGSSNLNVETSTFITASGYGRGTGG